MSKSKAAINSIGSETETAETGTAAAGPGSDLPLSVMIAIDRLHPHPRNYNDHPDDQLEHIMQSITENGIYKNIVAARDLTILAGHGVYKGAKRLDYKELPVVVLDISPDSPEALKVIVGDNEISHLSDKNDRLLTELLKEVKESADGGLLGTGYDEMMLANLIFVTRPESEIESINEAAEWVGMPEYDAGSTPTKLVVSFRNQEDRTAFAKLVGAEITEKTKSIWYPDRPNEDVSSLRWVSETELGLETETEEAEEQEEEAESEN
jgi:hypothetical protein